MFLTYFPESQRLSQFSTDFDEIFQGEELFLSHAATTFHSHSGMKFSLENIVGPYTIAKKLNHLAAGMYCTCQMV